MVRLIHSPMAARLITSLIIPSSRTILIFKWRTMVASRSWSLYLLKSQISFSVSKIRVKMDSYKLRLLTEIVWGPLFAQFRAFYVPISEKCSLGT
jgi:tryptophan-rich sensory protein